MRIRFGWRHAILLALAEVHVSGSMDLAGALLVIKENLGALRAAVALLRTGGINHCAGLHDNAAQPVFSGQKKFSFRSTQVVLLSGFSLLTGAYLSGGLHVVHAIVGLEEYHQAVSVEVTRGLRDVHHIKQGLAWCLGARGLL